MPTIEELVVLWKHAKALATRSMQTSHVFTDINKMADESENVAKAVGNALRDVTRKHDGLVWGKIKRWDMEDKGVAQVYKIVAKNRK